ncbi:MAG: hypothetical protein ACPGJS_12510 [Flammeovirgaceae bacterium]
MSIAIEQLLEQLPKINSALEHAEQITNMTWYSFLESNEALKLVYIFRPQSDQLLIAKNGRVLDYTWSFIPNTNSLIIHKDGQKLLYNALLFKHHYLVLRLDGSKEFMLLINQAYIHRLVEADSSRLVDFVLSDLRKILPEPEIPTLSVPIIEETSTETPLVEENHAYESLEQVEEEANPIEEMEINLEKSTTEDHLQQEPVAEELPETGSTEMDLEEDEMEEGFSTVEPLLNEDKAEEQTAEDRPKSILEKLQQKNGIAAEEEEIVEKEDEIVYPFGEKKASLNDRLKEKLHKQKQGTLLDKLSEKVKKD